jgi:hypothetical protein
MVEITHAEIRERFKSIGSVINSEYLTKQATNGLALDDMVSISTSNGHLAEAAKVFFQGLPEQNEFVRAVTKSDKTQQATFEGLVTTMWHTGDYNAAMHVAEGALALRGDIGEIFMQLASVGSKYGKNFIYAITDATHTINDNDYLINMLHNVWTSITDHDNKKEANRVLKIGEKVYEITEKYNHVDNYRNRITEFIGYVIENCDFKAIDKLGKIFEKYSKFGEKVIEHLLDQFELAYLVEDDHRKNSSELEQEKKAVYSEAFNNVFDALLDKAVLDGIDWHSNNPIPDVAKYLINITTLSEHKEATHNAGIIANVYEMEANQILSAIVHRLEQGEVQDKQLKAWTEVFLDQSLHNFIKTRPLFEYFLTRDIDTIGSDVIIESAIGIVLSYDRVDEATSTLETYSELLFNLDESVGIEFAINLADVTNSERTDNQKRKVITSMMESYKQSEVSEFYERLYNCRKRVAEKDDLIDSFGQFIVKAQSPEIILKAIDITKRRGYYVLDYLGKIAEKGNHTLLKNTIELALVCPRNKLENQLEKINKRMYGIQSDSVNDYVRQRIRAYNK